MNTAIVSKCQGLAAFARSFGYNVEPHRHGKRTSYSLENDHVKFHIHTVSTKDRFFASICAIHGDFRGSNFAATILTPETNALMAKYLCNISQEKLYEYVALNSHQV